MTCRVVAVASAVTLLVSAAVLALAPEPFAELHWANWSQLVAAVAAAAAAGLRARTCAGRERASWWAMAAACGSWAAGQAWWTAVESVAGGQPPFPSVADVGFLLFPLLAGVSLALRGNPRRWRPRWVLEHLVAASSVGLLGWLLVLGPLLRDDRSGQPLATALALAYPVLDVVLLALAVRTLARTDRGLGAARLLALGLVCFAAADAWFAYVGDGSAGLLNLGWLAGFLCLALAAALPAPPSAGGAADPEQHPALLPAYLPGLLLLASLVHLAVVDLPAVPTTELLVATGTLALAMGVNLLGQVDTSTRAVLLAHSREQLRHQALHDPLTGLANRALFTQRLETAVAEHGALRHPLAVLFLDLDGFKGINDTLGHPTGDDLLVQVGLRLTGSVRGSDLVARFGGDEFAVLLAASTDTPLVVGRLAEAMQRPYLLLGDEHRVAASIGYLDVGVHDPTPTPAAVLARADDAMYAAKRAGKGRVVAWTPSVPVGGGVEG